MLSAGSLAEQVEWLKCMLTLKATTGAGGSLSMVKARSALAKLESQLAETAEKEDAP